jgi:D-alanyl-D-alanine carboxypeptidase (penicillin-binding protein 5/6)
MIQIHRAKVTKNLIIGILNFVLFSTLIFSPAEAAFSKKTKNNSETASKNSLSNEKYETDDVKPTTSFKDVPVDVDVKAREAYMIDFDTGTVLLDKNASAPMHPSSMTKIMTAYLVVEKLKSGVIKKDQLFNVTQNAFQVEGSSMYLPINGQVTVMDLLKGLIIQSGNDASVALAENIAGSESAFAREMTRKAKELGATATNFVNTSGLPDPLHLTTAKDLAIISKHMIQEQQDYYGIYSEKEFEFNKIKQGNRNPLLYKNIGCDGIKTGHTSIAGYGLVASCVEGGRRLILVINGLNSQNSRSNEAQKLINWGMKSFINKTVIKGNTPLGVVPVKYGNLDFVEGELVKDYILTLPQADQEQVKIEIKLLDGVEAPIKKGSVVGHAFITSPVLMQPIQVELMSKMDVSRLSFFGRIWQDCLNMISTKKNSKILLEYVSDQNGKEIK